MDAAPLGLIASLKVLRRTHDLVFIDQRGVSGAERLDCPSPAARSPAAGEMIGLYDPARLAGCRKAVASRAARLRPNSATFAADVETVRRALGSPRIELIGYFYGTRIVQQYLLRWPARVSAAVLTDVSPLDDPESAAGPPAVAASVRATIEACRREAACNARYPGLASDWNRVAARLRRTVLAGKVASEDLATDGNGILDWLGGRTVRWTAAVDWPHDVHALATGRDGEVLPRYLAYRHAILTGYPLALKLSVDCAEGLARQAPAPVQGAAWMYEGPNGLRAEAQACRTWPHAAPAPARGGAHVRAPVLAITAEFDVEAPADRARRALAAFPNARVVVLPGRARAADFDWDDCVGPLATAFLDSYGRGSPDARCARTLKRPPFAEPSPG